MTPEDEPDFAPLHAMVIDWIREITGVRTSGKTPGDLKAPAHVVYSLGGHETDPGLAEEVTFDVQTFAPDYDTASRLAREARAAIRRLAGRNVAGDPRKLVDSTVCVTTPYPSDYENPNVTRMVGTYRVSARVQ